MAAKYILAALAVLFLALSLLRGGPAAKTWLIVALVFGAVSLWLWTEGHG